MAIASVNPATGKELARYEPLTDAQLEERLELAAVTFRAWRQTPFGERAGRMLELAELLDAEKGRWGELIATEMGKPIGQAVAEIEKCAWGARYYADHAEEMLHAKSVDTDATRSFIRYEPLGPILAVMPWNFPFWQVFRFAAPGLMAGNVALLKHASNVPMTALVIEGLFRRASFPEGVFQTLLIPSERVPDIIADPRVAAVTLTGSTVAGASVAKAAGAHIKPTVLELGGSDPFIVLPSANLERAVESAVQGRIVNSGQSCIAAKRFIVQSEIAAAFESQFVARMAALRVGDPLDPATEVGPLATPAIIEDLDRQVRETVAAGARLLFGGERLEGPGNYYAPTVLADVPPGTPAHREELFGPVASLFRATDIHEAIRLANDTPFGLGASVWTNDPSEQEQLIAGIEAGMVFVNGLVRSDPRLPFGGIKRSGYGRELSHYGIREFVNVKAVWISA
jgi:succinate-semialdehyde dehydrogenase / glutarate-semialdehyde dehydrogenase